MPERRPLAERHICGRPIAIREEVGWATVDLRTRVSLSPPDTVPRAFVVHVACARESPLLKPEDG